VTASTLDQFLKACGASGPIRLIIEGPGPLAAEAHAMTQPFLVVGRGPEVDLQLDHPEVSRRHAYFQVIAGRLFCVDLQSRSGTSWSDGPRLMGWVRPGRAVQIGPYRIRLAPDAALDAAAPSPSPSDSMLPAVEPAEASLEIIGPAPARTLWRMRRALVMLGRSRPCWVRLPSRDVSRIHCGLVRTPAGIWVIDLLGRGGIAVNERSTRWARLDHGDRLDVGPYQIRLRSGPAAEGSELATIAPRPALLPERAPGPPSLPAPSPSWRPTTLVTRPDLDASALAPILQELGQMQQQMADHFQQTLITVFQLFSTMHQDQMGLIREELAEIRRLSQEQKDLQAELRRRDEASVAAPSPVNGALPIQPERVMPPPADRTAARPSTAPPHRVPPPPPEAQGQARPQTQDDLHALINRRLMAIQEERQTRWQKLMQSVMGGEGDRS
jgi:pSer/pThr/pTyr-binding forkhead associated (FHA) protein